MKNNYFDKTSRIESTKGKYEYIKNHSTYSTLNSWNCLYSIANNVKIHSIGLTSQQIDKAYELLECEEFYDTFNFFIQDWETENEWHKIGFNGRSGGYLVLYNKTNNSCAVNDDYWNWDSYKDFLQSFIDSGYTFREAQKQAKYQVESDFEIVKNFDKLCDDLRRELIYMIDNAEISKEEYQITKTRMVLNYA